MHPPLLDTRNFRPLRLACNMVTYAHHFFLKERNSVPADVNLSHRTDPIVSQGWKPQAQACGLWMS
ncbi:hypothetical protein J2X16_000001, partial [Pelomonas aquatica]|nr:hypothetical protein [Pelomonas aquatica]